MKQHPVVRTTILVRPIEVWKFNRRVSAIATCTRLPIQASTPFLLHWTADEWLIRGLLNKQVAFELGIVEYTVQIHRSHIMRKMEADSFATLVKLASKFIPEPTGM